HYDQPRRNGKKKAVVSPFGRARLLPSRCLRLGRSLALPNGDTAKKADAKIRCALLVVLGVRLECSSRHSCPLSTAHRGNRLPARDSRLSGSYHQGRDIMAFSLPPLPYAPDALEPSIDKMTMEIHHGRHHKTYVDNLNKALEGQAALQNKPIDQLL